MKRGHDEISSAENGDVKVVIEKPVGAPQVEGTTSAAPSKGNGALKVEAGAAAGTQSSTPTAPSNISSSGAPSGGDRRKCPYLDTINRNVLDFDFEKV